jgi:inner membrane transporter RhtA
VLAAVVGAVVLGEALALLDWFAIALIVTANALGVLLTPTAQPDHAVAEPAPL